ncbi:hypothetical protein ACFOPQ_08655 [Deinococcus antarcticus]|uniref:Oxidoreductase molybdopterin-binding domain-containing protein n=1 Tax=Deinococcus antarcticus TaxID=1298767 RepID=A0ABV8A570_9DEIO
MPGRSLTFILASLLTTLTLTSGAAAGAAAEPASTPARLPRHAPAGELALDSRPTPPSPAQEQKQSAAKSTATPLPRSARTPVPTAPVPTAPVPSPVSFGAFRLPAAQAGEKRLLTLEFGRSRLQLTRNQLKALPAATLVTRHAQLGRTSAYQGVLLKTLASAMHSSGRDLRVYASNGFVTTIPAQDYLNAPIMLAYAANGKPISILEKGPLTIVLPSADARFQNKGAYWVWFVERLTPVPAP